MVKTTRQRINDVIDTLTDFREMLHNDIPNFEPRGRDNYSQAILDLSDIAEEQAAVECFEEEYIKYDKQGD